MIILAIDPGNEVSGAVWYDTMDCRVLDTVNEIKNGDLRSCIRSPHITHSVVAIEYTPPYSMTTKSGHNYVPNEVALTCIEIGRLIECAGENWAMHSRTKIKLHLLGKASGDDKAVTQAILSRFGDTMKAAKGTKKSPGPLHGIAGHAWAALAVAIYHAECHVQGG